MMQLQWRQGACVTLLGLILSGCGAESSQTSSLTLTNPLNSPRVDESILVCHAQLQSLGFEVTPSLSARINGKVVPSQFIDTDGDEQPDSLLLVTDFAANERKQVTFSSNPETTQFPKRTQATFAKMFGGTLEDGKYTGGEYRAINQDTLEHTHLPGDVLYPFEGPGWESDKVAYRLYFDHRNIIDIFGKKTRDMVLDHVGQDGHSYHHLNDWGMDILKVGKSLGVGAPALWENSAVEAVNNADSMQAEVSADGSLYSEVTIKHKNWHVAEQQYQLTNRLSIMAGSRLSHSQLSISPSPEAMATGIVKHPNTQMLSSDNQSGQWRYLASWGVQTEASDYLGMAIFYKADELVEQTTDENNYLLVLAPKDGKLDYYFAAGWEQESKIFATLEGFKTYLDSTLKLMNHPVEITVN